MNTYVMQMDLGKVRKDEKNNFFDLKDCSGPDCVLALEQNCSWVMELCATLAGCEPWPAHRHFKARYYISNSSDHNIQFVSSSGHLLQNGTSLWNLSSRGHEETNQGP